MFWNDDGYQLVEMLGGDAGVRYRCLRRFDSAYAAAEALRWALRVRRKDACCWRVLQGDGTVFLCPDDVDTGDTLVDVPPPAYG